MSANAPQAPAEYVLTQRGRDALCALLGAVAAVAVTVATMRVLASQSAEQHAQLQRDHVALKASIAPREQQLQNLQSTAEQLSATLQGLREQQGKDIASLEAAHSAYPRFYQERYLNPHGDMAAVISSMKSRSTGDRKTP